MKKSNCRTIKEYVDNPESKPLYTGMRDLDSVTQGFYPGELICIAGRPSMGSTGLAIGFVNRMCVENKKNCLYFSLSESGKCIINRLAADVAKDPMICASGHERELRDTLDRIGKAQIFINETAFELREIEKACRQMSKKRQLDLVIIDYYQMISVAKKKQTMISARLKKLARSIGCTVMILCELDRSIDARKDRRPRFSDLGRIGFMNHYADKVLLLYRDGYYDAERINDGEAKVFVAKNSYGRCLGTVLLSYMDCGIFEEKSHS